MIRHSLISILLFAASAIAQQVQTTPPKPTLRELTIENIFDPKRRVAFSGAPQGGFVWLDDKTFTWPRTDEKGDIIEQAVIDTESGKKRTLFDAAKLQATARKIAGVTEEEAKRLSQQRTWNFSPNKKSIILTVGDDLYSYTFDSDSLTRLTSTPGEEQEPSFSPDGRFIAFVRNNNLYVVDAATQRERQLTTDGNENMLDGIFDWVYQEEVYGRGNFRGYWWSPDSSHIVYLQLDERPVKRFTVVDHIQKITWLKDGSFLWLSERSGFKHLYQYTADGTLEKQITNGPWEVRSLHGIDNHNDWIYFSGTERSVLGTDVYRVHLDGSGLARLSDAAGEHRAIFNPAMTQYVDSWGDIQTPPQVSLLRNDGSRVRVIDTNEVTALRDYRISKPEFLQVKTRDGFAMEAMIIKPPDFDPSRKYPVYEYTYSGPHAQQVRNGWRGTQYLWWQLLAQRGLIVWVCDNRTASGKGVESTWPVYKHFGELELRDLEDGLRWLTSQPYVDGLRVVLDGWSYGGFMTSYALTHSTMWSAGIAGGTVSDWHDYDSIYTERYMLMPQNNPDGYQNSSPRFAAKDLHGALLLLHGTIDDNVHMQNTIQFAYELEKADKPFRLMVYPKSRHGVSDPLLVQHLRMTMLQFIDDNLLRK